MFIPLGSSCKYSQCPVPKQIHLPPFLFYKSLTKHILTSLKRFHSICMIHILFTHHSIITQFCKGNLDFLPMKCTDKKTCSGYFFTKLTELYFLYVTGGKGLISVTRTYISKTIWPPCILTFRTTYNVT